MFNLDRANPRSLRASLGGRALRLSAAATLNFCLASGCVLEHRPGDGLVSDGLEVSLNPTVVYDAGVPEAAISGDIPPELMCKAPQLFAEKVIPHLIKRCYECHDGTSGRALIVLNMRELKGPDLSLNCALIRLQGATEPMDKLQAPMITSADPARPDKDHEFKYEDLNEFNAYKNDVLTWLNAER